MAELHIKTLKCVKKQDALGDDEAKLQVNGSTISGPHSLGKGETVTITDTQAGIGTLTAFFNALPHADYHMTYDVHR